MHIRGLNNAKRFMVLFAKMFKKHFPTQLYACYVHQAPSFFSSVYDLLRPILPKASRDKIVIVREKGQLPQPDSQDDATMTPLAGSDRPDDVRTSLQPTQYHAEDEEGVGR